MDKEAKLKERGERHGYSIAILDMKTCFVGTAQGAQNIQEFCSL